MITSRREPASRTGRSHSALSSSPVGFRESMLGKFLSHQTTDAHSCVQLAEHCVRFRLHERLGLRCEMTLPFEQFAQDVLQRKGDHNHPRTQHCTVQCGKVCADKGETLCVETRRPKCSHAKLAGHVGKNLNRLFGDEVKPEQGVARHRASLSTSLPSGDPDRYGNAGHRANCLNPGRCTVAAPTLRPYSPKQRSTCHYTHDAHARNKDSQRPCGYAIQHDRVHFHFCGSVA